MANRVREMGWLISLFSPLLSSSFSVIFFHVAPGDARKKSIYMDLQTEDPYWGKFVSLSLVSFGSASLHCSGYCWFTYLVASSRFLTNLSYNFHGFVDGRLAYPCHFLQLLLDWTKLLSLFLVSSGLTSLDRPVQRWFVFKRFLANLLYNLYSRWWTCHRLNLSSSSTLDSSGQCQFVFRRSLANSQEIA